MPGAKLLESNSWYFDRLYFVDVNTCDFCYSFPIGDINRAIFCRSCSFVANRIVRSIESSVVVFFLNGGSWV